MYCSVLSVYVEKRQKRLHLIHLEMPDHAIEVITNKHFAFSQKSIRSRKVMERRTKISLKDTASTVSIIMLRPCYVLKSRHTKHIKTIRLFYKKFYSKNLFSFFYCLYASTHLRVFFTHAKLSPGQCVVLYCCVV
jgi:hypothetical protein